jgi:hypothetical protein
LNFFSNISQLKSLKKTNLFFKNPLNIKKEVQIPKGNGKGCIKHKTTSEKNPLENNKLGLGF